MKLQNTLFYLHTSPSFDRGRERIKRKVDQFLLQRGLFWKILPVPFVKEERVDTLLLGIHRVIPGSTSNPIGKGGGLKSEQLLVISTKISLQCSVFPPSHRIITRITQQNEIDGV